MLTNTWTEAHSGLAVQRTAGEQTLDRPRWAPKGSDTGDWPSPARVYDYLLGGAHNFAADRQLAEQCLAAVPDTRLMARESRAFLRRAVRHLVNAGVRQFLDIGAGILAFDTVHEIAHRTAPDARVLYVDVDPVAVAHGRAVLAGDDRARFVQGDLRRPETIFQHPELPGVLDLDQPVALLFISVLQFILDQDDPYGIVAGLRDTVAPGSYLAIAHPTGDSRPVDMDRLTSLDRRAGTPTTVRPRADILRFFDGLALIEPGLAWAPQWRPDAPDEVERAERSGILGGVAYKAPA